MKQHDDFEFRDGVGRKNRTRRASVPMKFKVGFLASMDGRYDLTRTLRGLRDVIVADLGGPKELSHVKQTLIERFVWLEAMLQTLEHEMLTGKVKRADVLGTWLKAVNALSLLAKRVGIERRAVDVPPWIPQSAPNADGAGGAGDK